MKTDNETAVSDAFVQRFIEYRDDIHRIHQERQQVREAYDQFRLKERLADLMEEARTCEVLDDPRLRMFAQLFGEWTTAYNKGPAPKIWHSVCVKADTIVPPYVQGQRAAKRGYPRSCNPHEVFDNRLSWFKGYDSILKASAS